ncbi:hypothetical protein [Salipaludibacillus sp. CF4.18]|uniref:hypothetical protein n=1 Tax=Salipaludibacillus sp. CF4.18 TaxID=3373081 RepID=UPI003EE4AB80
MISKENFNFIVKRKVPRVVLIIAQILGIDKKEAYRSLISSQAYINLLNPELNLWGKSDGYVADQFFMERGYDLNRLHGEDSLVGNVDQEKNNNILEFDVFSKEDLIAYVYINFGSRYIKVNQYTDDILSRPVLKKDEDVTIEDILNFIADRCFPKERRNCNQLLTDLGLEHYSTIAIVKKTHGLQFDDFTWIRFNEEDIAYGDLKIRD